jgi:putative multicomponent Na+:H+ antiporter subunit B
MIGPDESYIYIIVGLLPIVASMVVFQVNPYHALAMRGILGAIAALVYSVLGAADVALTEALMGTFLAITLYAVAVRSSLVMRLGVLVDIDPTNPDEKPFQELQQALRQILSKRYMRLELLPYSDPQSLHQALLAKEIHGACRRAEPDHPQPYTTAIRLQKLYDILRHELATPTTTLAYVTVDADAHPAHPLPLSPDPLSPAPIAEENQP